MLKIEEILLFRFVFLPNIDRKDIINNFKKRKKKRNQMGRLWTKMGKGKKEVNKKEETNKKGIEMEI